MEAVAIPTMLIGEHVWVGFGASVAEEIEAVVADSPAASSGHTRRGESWSTCR